MLNKKKFYTAFASQLLINCILLLVLFSVYVYEARQSNFLFWSVTCISFLLIANIIFYTIYIDMINEAQQTEEFKILHNPKGIFGKEYPYNVGRYSKSTNSWQTCAYCETEEQAQKVLEELKNKYENK